MRNRVAKRVGPPALVVFLAGALLCLSCGRKGQDSYTMGAILPLTGNLALYGQNTKQGIDLAIDEINASGGVRGKKLVVLYEDSQGEAKIAVSALRKLLEQHVQVIIDDAVSTITLSLVPIATQKGVVILSTGASSPALSGSSPYFFRIWNSDSEEGVFAADLAWRRLGLRRVVVMYVNNDYGKGLSQVFSERFGSMGGIVVAQLDFDPKGREYRSLTAKVRALKPEGIYMVGYAPQTGLLTKQLRELGLGKVALIGTVATQDPKFLELAGSASEGVVYVYPKAPKGEVVAKFHSAFRAKYGSEPEILCDVGYDAARLIAHAWQEGGRTGDEIRSALLSIRGFEGASGLIGFDDRGDVHKPMVAKVIEHGRFVVLGGAKPYADR